MRSPGKGGLYGTECMATQQIREEIREIEIRIWNNIE